MNLQLQDFEGPFDLLLHLVRVSKMDIYTINIRDIIEQYIEFINKIDAYAIDEGSEYLVLASELIHLKSRMLVNKSIEDEEKDENEYSIQSEEDLRNKLIEYEKYKNMTETFKYLEENRNDYYTKLPENLKDYFEKPTTSKVTRKEYSVKERIKEIRNLLNVRKRVEFTELFDILTKEGVVVTFLSLLDMSKNAEVTLKQDKIFSTIIIEKVG